MTDDSKNFRPRDFALLILASEQGPPRRRARDQQADLIGSELRKQILRQIADLDPEPELMEQFLSEVISDTHGPRGPLRSLARALIDEWRWACTTPQYRDHLVGLFVETAAIEAIRDELLPNRGVPDA